MHNADDSIVIREAVALFYVCECAEFLVKVSGRYLEGVCSERQPVTRGNE